MVFRVMSCNATCRKSGASGFGGKPCTCRGWVFAILRCTQYDQIPSSRKAMIKGIRRAHAAYSALHCSWTNNLFLLLYISRKGKHAGVMVRISASVYESFQSSFKSERANNTGKDRSRTNLPTEVRCYLAEWLHQDCLCQLKEYSSYNCMHMKLM